MKNTLLTICFVTISLAGFAQLPEIGVKVGGNLAESSSQGTGAKLTPGSIAEFNVSMFMDFKLGNNFSVQPALGYSGKGGNFSESGNAETSYIHYRLSYAQLPVNIVCHIPVIAGEIYFGAGPYLAQGLSGEIKSAGLNNKGDAVTREHNVTFGNGDDADLRSTQLGADAIIGVQLKNNLIINANYDLGLTNDLPAGSTGKMRSRVVGLSIGYAFL